LEGEAITEEKAYIETWYNRISADQVEPDGTTDFDARFEQIKSGISHEAFFRKESMHLVSHRIVFQCPQN